MRLRKTGRRVDLPVAAKKNASKLFEFADHIGARRAIFVAPDEWANKSVRVKDVRRTDAVRGSDDKGEIMTLDALCSMENPPPALPSEPKNE